MNASDLKARYSALNGGHFFDRDTMKFFGDTMRNYGVRTLNVDGATWYELHRKRTVKHGLADSRYFRHADMYETTTDPRTAQENAA